MSKGVEIVKDPRRIGKHVSLVLDHLRDLGCEGVEVVKRKHLTISWEWGNRRLSINAPCTPRDEHHSLRFMLQDVRRAIREATQL